MGNNIFYKSASYVWRNTLLKWYRGHKKKQEERYWEEHLKRCGPENKDKTFYVIRRRDLYCGLFSLFLTNLQRIDDQLLVERRQHAAGLHITLGLFAFMHSYIIHIQSSVTAHDISSVGIQAALSAL